MREEIANLYNAYLSGAQLSGADLSNAYLNAAKVENTFFGDNEGITESQKQDFIKKGAIFSDRRTADIPGV